MTDTFDALSIEIRQLVASYLEKDRDLASYRLICRSTYHAIDEDDGSFWRIQFLKTFDPPRNVPSGGRLIVNNYYKKQYQCRKQVLRRKLRFGDGNTQEEVQCLSLIRVLINESFNVSSTKPNPLTHSSNMRQVNKLVKSKGLLDGVLLPERKGKYPHPRTNSVLLAVQLVLTHLSLTASPDSKMARTWAFLDSQLMVYMPTSHRPIFRGSNCQEIDIQWTLHVASFFRNHLLGKQELSFPSYDDLSSIERPQCWNKALSTSPRQLGKHWKGCYAYVDHDELAHIRSGLHETSPVQDHVSCENGEDFQDLSLNFPQGDTDSTWPDAFERILKSRTKIRYRAPTTRAQRRAAGTHSLPTGESVSFRFKGEGVDAKEGFLASGYFNSISPQQGIPGWQRMTMMKYWADEDTGEIDYSSLWAYEGVVLPGGMIMLGRWWHPNPDTTSEYSGPFIFWNVDKSMRTES